MDQNLEKMVIQVPGTLQVDIGGLLSALCSGTVVFLGSHLQKNLQRFNFVSDMGIIEISST